MNKPDTNADQVSIDAYETHKEKARKRQADIAKCGREIGTIPDCCNPTLRKKMSNDLGLFLKTCMPESFDLPYSKNHLVMIPHFQNAFLNGEKVVVAAPRAEGKTTICEGTSIWALLNGHTTFLVYVGASKEAAMASFESIKLELETNEILADYYPEAVYPIQKLQGQSNRCRGQICNGKNTNISWRSDKLVFPSIDGSPSCGSIFYACGYDGRLRGLKHKTPTGKNLRPSAVIFDDVQKDRTGRNPANADHLEAILKGVVKMLGRRNTRMTILVPGTRINPNCFMSRMLDRKRNPSYQGIHLKAINAFPENMQMWKKYWELWRSEAERLNALPSPPENCWSAAKDVANNFYKNNIEEMNRGSEISWAENIQKGDITALQSLMNLYLEDEGYFLTELQNEPQSGSAVDIAITPEILESKIIPVKKGIVPTGCDRITCAMDLQLNLIYWVVCAWGDGFAGHIVDWGTYPQQPYTDFSTDNAPNTLAVNYPGITFEGQLYQALTQTCDTIYNHEWIREDGASLRIERGLIDANWARTTDTVCTYLQRNPTLPIYPSRGKKPSSGSFFPAKNKMESRTNFSFLTKRQPGEKKQTVWIDTNTVKSLAAGALHKALGERGCVTIAQTHNTEYGLLFSHLTSQFVEKWKTGELEFDLWKIKPGRKEDHWWDCLCLNYVANAMCGGLLDEQDAPSKSKYIYGFDEMLKSGIKKIK